MNLKNFRVLCANENTTDDKLLKHIMVLKGGGIKFTDQEKAEIVGILKKYNRKKLANKVNRSINRHRNLC